MTALSRQDKELIRALTDDFPLVERPYEALARRAGMTEGEVLARLREWQAEGVLRRLCAYVRHRAAGYVANALVAFDPPEDRLAELGERVAESPMVSHCYARRPADRFPYRLYAMMHARSREDVIEEVERLSGGGSVLRRRVMFTVRELKRSTPPLFSEDEK